MGDVQELLTILVGFALVVLFTTGVVCMLAVRSVKRANRVVPERRSWAPTGWLWSVREPARLHRRLRRAATLARSSVVPLRPPRRGWRGSQPAASGLVAVADDLARRAVALDDELVGAAASPRPWRSSQLAGLAMQVQEVEAGAWRLAHLAAAWRRQLQQAALGEPVPVLEIGSRLDAFEAAMAELSRSGSR
jgi:hypothetical protein